MGYFWGEWGRFAGKKVGLSGIENSPNPRISCAAPFEWGGNCGFGPLVARGSQLRGLVLARPDLAVEPGRREQAAVTAARRRPTETAHDASKRPLREARPRPAAFAGAFRSIQSGCGWGGKALAECGPRR